MKILINKYCSIFINNLINARKYTPLPEVKKGQYYLLSQGTMIIICKNDIMIFTIKLVLFDLKGIISYFLHYNENKSFCHAVTNSFSKLASVLTCLLCHW